MPLYSNEVSVNNKLDSKGMMVLEEERLQTRKLFGITLKNSRYTRHTVKLDVDIQANDPNAIGFKNK